MRVARYFPLVVLASFIGQIAIPLTSRASDSAAFEVTDEPQPPDAQAQPERRFVDSAVQPAGFYDSRPRPNSTAVSPSESNSHHTGALFHGEFLHFPKLPFGRHTSYNEPTSATSGAAENLPRPSTPAEMRERELNQRATARMVQQRQWNGVSPQSTAIYGNNYQALHTTANLQPLPLRRSAAPQPMALPPRRVAVHPVTPASSTNKTISNGNMSSVSPWSMPKAAKPSTTPSRRPIAPPSPADRLLSQAHGLSTTAKTEPDYSRIVETCRRAEVSQPNLEAAKYAKSLTAWALNRRGQLKAEAGRDKEAILDFDDAIRTDASCWRAVHNRGVLLAQAGQFEKAFDDFNRTIQLNPQFAKAYSNRAALFMVANNLNSAHQDYKRAVELDPNLAVAHRGYGRVCQLLGRMDDAVAHYDAAVQLAPNDAYAAACRADLFTDIGRYSDALAEYNRALRIDPKSIQANCGSAWLLATCPDSALRNPQLAIERAEQAIELGGQRDAVSFDSLAAAQASAGEFDSAVQSIHKAIELAPLDERESYKERLVVYQQAKPFRIAPIERVAQQVSYETRSGQ